MHDSLMQNGNDFHIYMLCFDDLSIDHLKALNLKHITVIPLEAFEEGDHRLTATKMNRTLLEYYYTCGPSLPLYILNHYSEMDIITYLDADLYFYSNPLPLIQEMDGYSIGITVHNFPEYRKSPSTGKYNVGWLSFRRDGNGMSCLQWWRDRCIEWCYERFEDGKYADQLYLDQWPERFAGVKVLEHKGANVAAWNIADYTINKNNGKIMVEDYPLVFYHFHGFRQLSRHIYNTNLGLTFRIPSKIIKEEVFKPYIMALNKNKVNRNSTASVRSKRLRPKWIQMIRTILRTLIGIVFRQYIIVIDDNVY